MKGEEGEKQKKSVNCGLEVGGSRQTPVRTMLPRCLFQGLGLGVELSNSYLPGRGDTMIRKVVHPGRGSSIAQTGCADPCEFPKCGNLNCIISGSGGLRSRSPLVLFLSKGLWHRDVFLLLFGHSDRTNPVPCNHGCVLLK